MEIKLSQSDINNMRELRKQGHSIYKIADTFGIPSTLVYQNTADIRPVEAKRLKRVYLSDKDRQIMLNLHKQGLSNDQISRFLGITEITVLTNLKRLSKAI